jgi:hypothetical protein
MIYFIIASVIWCFFGFFSFVDANEYFEFGEIKTWWGLFLWSGPFGVILMILLLCFFACIDLFRK